MKVITKTPKQTQSLAKKIAKSVLASHHRGHAAVVALTGELGAGKTTFAQGFARALGVHGRIVSPTFIIFRHYTLHLTHYTSFYHVDAYRLQNPRELTAFGFKKILADQKNIVLVEWASKIKKILLRDTIWIKFYHGKNESEREMHIATIK